MKHSPESRGMFLAGITLATLGLAACSDNEPETVAYEPLTECQALLPEDRQYTMTISLDLDTRADQESTLRATLLDDANPDVPDVPEGTEEFIRCALGVLGVPEDLI